MFPWSRNFFAHKRFSWSTKTFIIVPQICLLALLLFIVEKIPLEPPLSSPWDPVMLHFIGGSFCHLYCISCLGDRDDFIGMVKHVKEKDKIILFTLIQDTFTVVIAG